MDKKTFEKVFKNATKEFKRLSPRDTGHLADRATKGKWVGSNHYVIYIDADVLISEANPRGDIAGYDYAYEINNTSRYRSYNYFERNGIAIARKIAKDLGGVLRK